MTPCSGDFGVFFLRKIKWPGRNCDQSSPSRTHVKNVWECVSSSTYAIIPCAETSLYFLLIIFNKVLCYFIVCGDWTNTARHSKEKHYKIFCAAIRIYWANIPPRFEVLPHLFHCFQEIFVLQFYWFRLPFYPFYLLMVIETIWHFTKSCGVNLVNLGGRWTAYPLPWDLSLCNCYSSIFASDGQT